MGSEMCIRDRSFDEIIFVVEICSLRSAGVNEQVLSRAKNVCEETSVWVDGSRYALIFSAASMGD